MFLHCALLCSEKVCVPSRPVVETKKYRPVPPKKWKYRPFPSWKNLCTVQSRREKLYALSRPVEKKKKKSRPVLIIFIYRPVQSLYTVPSRREAFYSPSRPVMKQKGHCNVPSRPVEKSAPTVPSRPIQATIIYIFLPSRPVPSLIFFPPNMSKQYRPVPSRTLPAMKSHGNNRLHFAFRVSVESSSNRRQNAEYQLFDTVVAVCGTSCVVKW